jgi:hypothetical protein
MTLRRISLPSSITFCGTSAGKRQSKPRIHSRKRTYPSGDCPYYETPGKPRGHTWPHPLFEVESHMSVLFLKYLYVLPAAGAAVFTQPAAILIPVINPAAAAYNAALAFRHLERGNIVS